MANSRRTDRHAGLNPTTASGDLVRVPVAPETDPDRSLRSDSVTEGDAVAALDVEGRAVFERVRERLGLSEDAERRMVGRFELLRMLGRGGMGSVYLAHDPALSREVALKLVHAQTFVSPERLRARLTHEGKALGKLRHPNIVSVFELGEHEGEVFLAMEYVAGETLRDFQERDTISDTDVLRAYIAAGRGLTAAHRAGVVHRDFKPENVFVSTEGRVQVGDFGLAAMDLLREPIAIDSGIPNADDQRLTQPGEVIGTLGYMAPEQLRGEPVTPRSDQYAFCVSVWEALARQHPFGGTTRAQLLAEMMVPPTRGADELHRWLRSALTRGMAFAAADRHEGMDTLLEVLERGLTRRVRWSRRAAMFLAGLITLGSTTYAILSKKPKPCELADAVERVRTLDSWSATRAYLGRAGAEDGLRTLEEHLDRLALDAHSVCLSGSPLLEEHLRDWVHSLGRLLETAHERALEQLLDDIEELGRARFDRPPPRPIADSVKRRLNESVESERRNQLSLALAQAEEAYADLATTPVERAVALLRIGRVRSLRGDYDQALVDFASARLIADAAEHDDARLRANLLAAEISLKRREDLDKAEHYLDDANALLERLNEPMLSPRRAEYNDLQASRAKRRWDLDTALAHQFRTVLRHAVVGDRRLLARALLNLGTIYEYRDQPALSERCYRAALDRLAEHDPDRYQVTLNLGVWLHMHGEGEAATREAESLLRETIAGRHELRIAATSTLLAVMINSDTLDTGQIREAADQLLMLLQAKAPATPTHIFEAWRVLTFAYALNSEFDDTFEFARQQVESTALDPVDLSQADLNLAAFCEQRPALAAALVERAVLRLEALPPSDHIEALLEHSRVLLAELAAEP